MNSVVLKLFNSYSGRKEAFVSLKAKTAKMYVCGITPYDVTHMGHAFTYISFDVLARYLTFNGLKVVYTQNVTNIDDDILRKANEESRNWRTLGDFWTKKYLEDMKMLNVSKPTYYVKATDSIGEIVKVVGTLLKKGSAYKSGGNVYFDVKKFKGYGRLSHFNVKQMKILLKERGGNPDDPNKRNPLDFILWQKWKDGEPFWNTPWGKGRPGWHIECSAMIKQHMGDQIDIHGGGRDLIFPHHESEIAQSESFTGKVPFAGYFMHTGMVMSMGEKMAKSLGNLVLVSELLKRHSPNAIRWIVLSHHYRRVWEYMPEDLRKADSYAKKIKEALKAGGSSKAHVNRNIVKEFCKAMDDDLDTPAALALLKELLEEGKDTATIKHISGILGFTN